MTKRLLCLIMIILVTLTPVAFAEESTTLQISYWGNAEELELNAQMLDRFEELHPNIKLERTYIDGGEYPIKLQTLIAANMAPDVMAMASDVFSPFKDIGAVEDLRPYLEEDNLLDAYAPIGLMAYTNRDGAIQAAPFSSMVFCIAYNKDMFDEAGLAYPTPDWTEEDFLTMARALTKGEGINKQFGFYWSWGASELIRSNFYGIKPIYDTNTMTMQATDNEPFRRALELLYTTIPGEGLAPDPTAEQSIGGGFETGKFGISLVFTSDIDPLDKLIGDTFNWDITTLPTNEEFGSWHSSLRLTGYMMSSKTPHKDAAWELIKYLTTNEDSVMIAGKLGIPMLDSVLSDKEKMASFTNADVDTSNFVKMIDSSTPFESAGIWSEINAAINDQIDMYLLGEIDIDEAIANMQAEGEALLP